MDVDRVDENERFIAECAEEARRQRNCPNNERPVAEDQQSTLQESERIIRQTEANKVQLYATPGKNLMSDLAPQLSHLSP